MFSFCLHGKVGTFPPYILWGDIPEYPLIVRPLFYAYPQNRSFIGRFIAFFETRNYKNTVCVLNFLVLYGRAVPFSPFSFYAKRIFAYSGSSKLDIFCFCMTCCLNAKSQQ